MFFVDAGRECDKDGQIVEYRISLDLLDDADQKAEPGDILLTQGDIYEVVGYEHKHGVVTGLLLELILCYEA